ncbi:MAG: hypothetical protein AABZ12_10930 [Planctomycetota bacterium]
MSKATCPVCKWEIKKEAKVVKIGGKSIRVCCDDCAAKVKANPAKYADG